MCFIVHSFRGILGFLTGSGSSASSFYLYFSYSVSLGEMTTVVLEGYLYVGVSLCTLSGFNTFDVRAVFSMGACRHFPQCVLLFIIPLTGVGQMWRLVPRTWGSWRWQLVTAPRAHVGGIVSPESAHGKRGCYGGCQPSPCMPPNNGTSPLRGAWHSST